MEEPVENEKIVNDFYLLTNSVDHSKHLLIIIALSNTHVHKVANSITKVGKFVLATRCFVTS